MTRQLSDLFDLPESPVSPDPVTPPTVDPPAVIQDDHIQAALPAVQGLELVDQEIDELAQQALTSYRDLLDLGMNVDPRFSAEILSVASSMMGHALNARTAKINRKIKTVELQMKKLALDQKIRAGRAPDDAPGQPLAGTAQVLDRNELLTRLIEANKNPGSQ